MRANVVDAPVRLGSQAGDVDTAAPTAVAYLRVSSPSQLTGHNPEGYSIEGQRQACERYAGSLRARIVREYIEPGRTATNTRRKALQQMLAELDEVRPNYVIFYDLSRVARDEPDAFWLLGQVGSHGAQLVSTREPVDSSPQGLLVFGLMASVNAFRSREDAVKVKLGLERKHADGGSHGPARIGYLNVREIADGGREVASIAVDPDRARHVRLGFELAATGAHTITTITEVLAEAGLRTRGTPKRPSKPLSRSMVHRVLRDDYYLGIVTRKGVKRDGRHEAIVDQQTFEQVQRVLDAHRASGDRSHRHTHYLTGSLYCGTCGKRLGFGRHRSRSGDYYEYYSCLSRVAKTGRCDAPYAPLHKVERSIEAKYKTLLLTEPEQDAIRKALCEHVEANAEVARREAKSHERRLRELSGQQQKLVQLYYKGGVSEEVMQAEQQRIEAERSASERWSNMARNEVADVMQALEDALALIDLATAPYLTASPTERRLINLAIYVMLIVCHDPDGVGIEPNTVFAELITLARQLDRERASSARRRSQANRDPLSLGRGSQLGQMAERAGFEPAMEFDPHTRLAGECLQPLGHLSWDGAAEFRGCWTSWSGSRARRDARG
jgi:site-specific DNA recombinase